MRRHKPIDWKSRLLLVFGFSLGLAVTTGFSAPASGGPFLREPYLQLAAPTTVVVVWRTDGVISPVVKYGDSPRHLTKTLSADQIQMRISLGTNQALITPQLQELRKPQYARLPKLHSAPPGAVQYEAHLIGLKPDTRYFYAIYDGTKRLTPEDPSYSLVSNPLIGKARPARFWVVGDSGTGREPQASVHRSMVARVEADRRPLDFYIHVGDMAYSKGRDPEFQAHFFEMYDTTLRNKVCWPAMGNHEGITSRGSNGIGPYYDAYVLPTRGESGGLASGTEAYYSFDYGRLHFICLDSHDLDRKPTGAMAQWLRADMDRTRADWLIAFWHHPPYTKGSHDSDKEMQLVEMREHIMPILEAGGVDLVLTGHSHIYERSMLMDGAYATPTVAEYVILDDGDGDPRGDGPYRKSAGLNPHEGAIQIVAGHGGASLGRKGTMPVMKRVIVEHGSVIIDVDGDTLTGFMLNKDGLERDRFSLVKKGRVVPSRIAQPLQLPPYTPPAKPSNDGAEDPPDDFIVLIEKHAEWSFQDGRTSPPSNWADLNYNAGSWLRGPAAFGYGNSHEFKTPLSDMKDNYRVLYLRREFSVVNAPSVSELGLMIDYDDAFVAYLNGKEVLRKGVSRKEGQLEITSHEANGYRYYSLKDFEKYLLEGTNVLALEGYNVNLDSSDFVLDPYLIMED